MYRLYAEYELGKRGESSRTSHGSAQADSLFCLGVEVLIQALGDNSHHAVGDTVILANACLSDEVVGALDDEKDLFPDELCAPLLDISVGDYVNNEHSRKIA